MTELKQRVIAYAERKMLENVGRSMFFEAFSGMVLIKASMGDKLIDLLRLRKPRPLRYAERASIEYKPTDGTITFKR